MFFPGFGSFALDSSYHSTTHTVNFELMCDLLTGKGTLAVSGGETPYMTLNGQLGVDIITGGTQINTAAVALDVGKTALSVGKSALAKDVAGTASNVVTGLGDIIESAMPNVVSMGCAGGVGHFLKPIQIIAQCFLLADEDRERLGRPVCKKMTLSAGYYLCEDGEVTCPATKSELAESKRYLESGVFVE